MNLALLFKTLNCKGDNAVMAIKFVGSLEGLSIDDLNNKIALLVQKGIITLDPNKPVLNPGSFKVLQNSYEYLEKQISRMESLGHLSAYKGKPERINSKEAPDRLQYLIEHNEEFRNKDGKYLKLIFSKRLFESRYGKISFAKENLVPEFAIKEQIIPDFSVYDATDSLNTVPVFEEVKTLETPEPVIESLDDEVKPEVVETLDNSANDIVVNNITDEVKNDNVVNFQEFVQEKNEQVVEESKTTVENPNVIVAPIVDIPKKEEEVVTYEPERVYGNPIEEILANPQTIGLNDETFERYERLADIIHCVLKKVYKTDEVNDSVIDNLIKLVTNEIPDDKTIIYYSIVNNKVISEEEVSRLNAAIDEELEYTSILDIEDINRVSSESSMGRTA